MVDRPTFSIVTVCRNAQELIGTSIDSLAAQTCQDFEYLVIDALSTDGTLDVVRERAAFASVRVISEADAGIYDAMNKGVRMAKGEWIYFLNAGDCFFDSTVLERAAAQFSRQPESQIAYGDAVYCSGEKKTLVRFDWLTGRNLPFEHLCHQAVFGKGLLFDRIGAFNTKFRINADFDWILRAFRADSHPLYLGFPVTLYDTEGFSAKSETARREERKRVREQYLPPVLGGLLVLGYRGYRKLVRVSGLSRR